MAFCGGRRVDFSNYCWLVLTSSLLLCNSLPGFLLNFRVDWLPCLSLPRTGNLITKCWMRLKTETSADWHQDFTLHHLRSRLSLTWSGYKRTSPPSPGQKYYGWLIYWTDGWMGGWMNTWTHECMSVSRCHWMMWPHLFSVPWRTFTWPLGKNNGLHKKV